MTYTDTKIPVSVQIILQTESPAAVDLHQPLFLSDVSLLKIFVESLLFHFDTESSPGNQ